MIEGWGGSPDATVIGTGARVPAHNAALVNSALARAMELDDVHEQALVHATATMVPVALAVAEQAGGVSGRRSSTPWRSVTTSRAGWRSRSTCGSAAPTARLA